MEIEKKIIIMDYKLHKLKTIILKGKVYK